MSKGKLRNKIHIYKLGVMGTMCTMVPPDLRDNTCDYQHITLSITDGYNSTTVILSLKDLAGLLRLIVDIVEM